MVQVLSSCLDIPHLKHYCPAIAEIATTACQLTYPVNWTEFLGLNQRNAYNIQEFLRPRMYLLRFVDVQPPPSQRHTEDVSLVFDRGEMCICKFYF